MPGVVIPLSQISVKPPKELTDGTIFHVVALFDPRTATGFVVITSNEGRGKVFQYSDVGIGSLKSLAENVRVAISNIGCDLCASGAAYMDTNKVFCEAVHTSNWRAQKDFHIWCKFNANPLWSV